jgi:hypothetical protein
MNRGIVMKNLFSMILLMGLLQLCFINAESHDSKELFSINKVAANPQQTLSYIKYKSDKEEFFVKIKQAEQDIERLKHEKRMNEHAMAMSTFVTIGTTGFAIAGICELFKLFCLQGQPAAPAA